MADTPNCWVLTDDRAGNLASARGLAEVAGLSYQHITVDLHRPWSWLPPKLWPPGVLGMTAPQEPFPDVIISCGRKAVGPALELKRRSGGQIIACHIQHPRVSPDRFDLVAVPAHDRLSGPNIEVTLGSLHGVTPQKLQAAAQTWGPKLAHLPEPRIAVLIGGSNGVYTLDAPTGRRLGDQLSTLARETGAGLMVTMSRRTDPMVGAALRDRLQHLPATFFDGDGENPYFGYLGLAQHILATCDSVNMVSEAASTGQPVQVIPLPMTGTRDKFERFHEALVSADVVRPFDGALVQWPNKKLDDTQKVAGRLLALIDKTRK